MSIDNLYYIRVCAERISLETKSRPVYSVSSLPRPFSEREKRRERSLKIHVFKQTYEECFLRIPFYLFTDDMTLTRFYPN